MRKKRYMYIQKEKQEEEEEEEEEEMVLSKILTNHQLMPYT